MSAVSSGPTSDFSPLTSRPPAGPRQDHGQLQGSEVQLHLAGVQEPESHLLGRGGERRSGVSSPPGLLNPPLPPLRKPLHRERKGEEEGRGRRERKGERKERGREEVEEGELPSADSSMESPSTPTELQGHNESSLLTNNDLCKTVIYVLFR